MEKDQSTALKKFYMVIRPGLNEMHSVHMDGCPFLPAENKRIFLGKFISLTEARYEGSKYFHKNCGCRFCTARPGGNEKGTVVNIESGSMDLQNSELLKYLN